MPVLAATPRLRRTLSAARIALLGLGLPVLVWALAREEVLDRARPAVLAAGFAASQLAMVLYALRFRAVMRLVGVRLELAETLRLTTLALFYQYFVPFAPGGDMAKFVKLRARGHRASAAAAGIVLDHAVGLAALATGSATLFVLLEPFGPGLDGGRAAALALAALLCSGLGARLALRLARRRGLPLTSLARVWRTRRGVLGAAFVTALAMQALLGAAVWLGAQACGLTVAYPTLLFVLCTAAMLQAVPGSLAGIGAAELAGTGLYIALGVSPGAALALTSLLVCYRLALAVVGGVWDLWPVPAATPAGTSVAADPMRPAAAPP